MVPKHQFTLADGSPLTRQESFVLRQVAAGEIADLKQQFGEAEEDRRLRARFLEELLTGVLKGVEIHRRGVWIRNAVVEESMDLQNALVGDSVELDTCIFKESVSFRDASLEYLDLSGSHFFDEVDFEGMKVEKNVFFSEAIFEGPVDFRAAAIDGYLVAQKAKFLSETQDVIFSGMKIGQSARFDVAEFHGPVNFSGVEIQCQLGAQDARFISKEQIAIFNGIIVGQDARFDGAEFNGPVNFIGAEIKGQFGAAGTKFLSDKQEVTFNSISVNNAFFDDAEFRGPVDFVAANVNGHLKVVRAKFLAKELEANFSAIQVDQDADFDLAEFHGPASFYGANIKGNFGADGAIFLSQNHKAVFTRMQVGQDAFFKGCDFHGLVSFVKVKIGGDLHLEPLLKIGQELATTFRSDVNFHGADIGGELLADKAQFLGHISDFEAVKVGRSFHASGALFGGSVYFGEMQVNNNFYVNPFGRMKSFKTLFKGAANFSDLEVHGVFNADKAIFKSESTIFSGLKVGQAAFFNGTIFFGGLVLKEGQLTDLVIRGLHRLSKGGLPLAEIVLNRTRIAHRLTIEDVEVKRFNARNLEVKGPTELSRLFIREEADLRDAALHHLQIVEIDWPEPQDGKEKVFLDGLAYESITTRKEPDKREDWPKLLAWLGVGRFNTQNYQQLDGFFQRGGFRKWADKVGIAGKRRELGKMKWWHPANWLTRFFWGLLAGYGRKPGRTLWISLGLIILGALLLDPVKVLAPEFLNNLAGYQDNVAHTIALRLIVSLYSFVAAIPGWGSHLSLASPEFHLFVFLWFQRICGWILIPIGLAAVYTRLK